MNSTIGGTTGRRMLRAVGAGALLLGALVTVPPPQRSGADPASAPAQAPALSTPDLIDRAYAHGEIDSDTRWLYIAYALTSPERLPASFIGNAPWDGTLPLLDLQNAVSATPDASSPVRSSAIRAQIADLLLPRSTTVARGPLPPDAAVRACSTYADPATHIYETDHFYIEYFAPELVAGGLTIDNYADSLEAAWAKEVTSFGWAPPPVKTSDPPPGNRYHVRLEPIGPGAYGLVTSSGRHGGDIGDNPATAWTEPDALATCMVLNTNFDTGFPGTAQQALDATTAHEFNHSLHAGYGALTGANRPDLNLVEGGAVWMEDEVQDGANDYYNFLWPKFDDSMGEYDQGDEYAYGVTWRGLTERYGTTVAGGSEDVMQHVWERISQSGVNANGRIMLDAINLALVDEGTNLADAYHAYAIAVQFLRPCGGGYAYPYCLEEGPAWRTAAGDPGVNGTLTNPSSGSGSIEDNYALNWVNLPTTGTYDVTLSNTSLGGSLRASLVCDTGTGFVISPMPAVVGSLASTNLVGVTPSGCQRMVAVITNQAQTAANPASSPARSYTLALSNGSTPTTTTTSTTSTSTPTTTTSTSTTTAPTTTTTTTPPPPPAPGGLVVDGIGGVNGYGSSGPIATGRFGSDVTRDIALIDPDTGYVLDAFGGINAFGGAPIIDKGNRFGAPVARALIMLPNGTSGYVLDGLGGVNAFGGAPILDSGGRFGSDVARDFALVSASGGYVLDSIGGIHAFGNAPKIDKGSRFGAPVAKAITFIHGGAGYVLDAFGGINAFGTAPIVDKGGRYGIDMARDIVLQSASPVGGYTLDGLGGVHVFGSALAVDKGARFGSDIARGLVSAQTFKN